MHCNNLGALDHWCPMHTGLGQKFTCYRVISAAPGNDTCTVYMNYIVQNLTTYQCQSQFLCLLVHVTCERTLGSCPLFLVNFKQKTPVTRHLETVNDFPLAQGIQDSFCCTSFFSACFQSPQDKIALNCQFDWKASSLVLQPISCKSLTQGEGT